MLVVVGAAESQKIVFEKTELNGKEESKSDSCTGAVGQSEGMISAGSLGGLTGGVGSGSL